MTPTALTSTRKPAQATRRPHPLLAVLAWELRRLWASRSTWLLALVFFALFLFTIWSDRGPSTFLTHYESPTLSYAFSGNIPYVSPARLSYQLHRSALLLLLMALPFLCADGVARDLRRRTHELMMTTSIPTWAYVSGRYLIVLGLSLGLGVELLIAILVMGLALHLSVGGPEYTSPQVGPVIALWAALALPTIVLVSSAAFMLGTLLPRYATLVKVGVMLGWFIWAMIFNAQVFWGRTPDWYINWDPSGAFLGGYYDTSFAEMVRAAGPGPTRSQALLQRLFEMAQYQLPHFWSWLIPHLVWAAFGLVLAALASLTFKRFRTV